jgi:hypothetical protein
MAHLNVGTRHAGSGVTLLSPPAVRAETGLVSVSEKYKQMKRVTVATQSTRVGGPKI